MKKGGWPTLTVCGRERSLRSTEDQTDFGESTGGLTPERQATAVESTGGLMPERQATAIGKSTSGQTPEGQSASRRIGDASRIGKQPAMHVQTNKQKGGGSS
jgi:hypothetical protein